jgi:ABC-type oligopeptide transport system ATPase subunit
MTKPLKQVMAEYQPITVPAAYAGNPLIEALPHIFSEDKVAEELRYIPEVTTALEKALPPHERIHCVSAIEDLVIPLPVAFDVEAALSVLIRRGYAARNPFNREWRRKHFDIKKIMSEPLEEYQVRSKSVPAIMITGVSGNGKTTLAETLLEMYSQTIIHTDYKGESFAVKQLVWIGVNASFDASLKGLVLSMFGAVDAALGTNYRQQYENSTRTIDTMIGNLAQVFATHHLGVLFVDEIQCLMLRGDHEAELALSLFLKIANVCRVPIVFSGTYAAVRLFSKVARNARRVCSGGYFDLALPSRYDDVVWDKLVIEVVWKKFQWVKKPAPLSDDLRKQIFHLSQGIMAIFIALHRAAQVHAIRHNLDTVDGKLLKDVYDRQFILMHPALAALRSHKKNRLEKFEDLLPPKEQLDAMLLPDNGELLAERIQRLLSASHEVAEKTSTQSISPEQKKQNDADHATAELLKKIGSNAELKELARRAGLIEG